MPTCGYAESPAGLRYGVAAKRLMAGFRLPLNSEFLTGIRSFRVRDPLFPLNSEFLTESACVPSPEGPLAALAGREVARAAACAFRGEVEHGFSGHRNGKRPKHIMFSVAFRRFLGSSILLCR